jgi:hypothetical protein
MNNDESLIAEAYTRIYHESDKEFAMDDLAAAASDFEDQADTNDESDVLKKYTYEILYKTDYKYDPKTKKVISYAYKTHSSGRPDLRHKFAYSKEEALKAIYNSLPGVSDVEDAVVIRKEEPADHKEVEAEKRHDSAVTDYYDKASKTGARGE